jgi:hypothetical protein
MKMKNLILDAPPCEPHYHEYHYDHEDSGYTLVCHFEYDDGIPENDIDPQMTLLAAYVGGVDVAPLLHFKMIDRIERKALDELG